MLQLVSVFVATCWRVTQEDTVAEEVLRQLKTYIYRAGDLRQSWRPRCTCPGGIIAAENPNSVSLPSKKGCHRFFSSFSRSTARDIVRSLTDCRVVMLQYSSACHWSFRNSQHTCRLVELTPHLSAASSRSSPSSAIASTGIRPSRSLTPRSAPAASSAITVPR